MENNNSQSKQEKDEKEIFVVSATPVGFNVYSPLESDIVYTVQGPPEYPFCNCEEYEKNQTQQIYDCVHIKAVRNQWDIPDDL